MQGCENYGQRVQKSVFECRVTHAQYEQLVDDLTDRMDESEDSLRIYRLAQPREENVECWGIDTRIDLDEPLVF